jgi:hypothetical protein
VHAANHPDSPSARVAVGYGAPVDQLHVARLTFTQTRPDVIEQIRREHVAAVADAAGTKYVRLQSG